MDHETDLLIFDLLRYDADVKPRALPQAAHQAAVEISLMQLLGKPLTSVCEIATHDPKIQDMLNGCVVLGSEPLSTALRFPNQDSMDALVFVFSQIGGKTEAQIESPEKFILEGEPVKITQGPHHTLSLTDSQIKFAVRFPSSYPRRSLLTTSTVRQALLPAHGPSHP